MNSGKLKLLIILVLLSVNAFFLFKLMDLRDAKNRFTESEISEAVDVLSTKGIRISKDAVLREKVVPNTVKLDFDITAIESVASKIMHGDYGSFKIPNGQRFAGDKESFSVFDDYSFEYSNFDYPMTREDTEKVLATAQEVDDKKCKEYEKLFTKLFDGIETDEHKITLSITHLVEKDGLTYVRATEVIDGYRLENASVVTVFSDKRSIYAYGTFYLSQQTSDYRTDYLDSINILFEIDETDEEIEKMETVYYPISDNGTSFYMAPAYKFSYKNGNVELYDATSGSKR